jgi:ribokinase
VRLQQPPAAALAARAAGPDTLVVLDTTGAGDAFVAALTLGLVRGDEPAVAAHAATAAATRTVRYAGGRPRLNRAR